MLTYNDIAIPLAWPEKTAYGDEFWMSWLKKCGIVKNLNFKVGHAAILLVERQSGFVSYFDFGRYIAPRGYGRARSDQFDPRLTITTRAIFKPFSSEINNLEEILKELAEKEPFTHGGGKLLFAVATQISYELAAVYAKKIVEQGPILYGALATGNNSCSRYVAQVLTQGMDSKDSRIRKILYPECLKASPTSNIVNASPENFIFCYDNGQLETWNMSRKSSLKYQWNLLQDNLSHKKAKSLAKDDNLGWITEPVRPFFLPSDIYWLGGIGEGMWFRLTADDKENGHYRITAYCLEGNLIYESKVKCKDDAFDIDQPYQFSMRLSGTYFTIEQKNRDFLFTKLIEQESNYKQKVY
ncbi:MAG TPA: hypothetical protein PKA53_02855 [Sphingobacterium sp.]|nr:hypothetical protein [Sphingobacterium sp.]